MISLTYGCHIAVGINIYLNQWRKNGYRGANGQRVVNAPLFQYLGKLLDVLKSSGTDITLQGTSNLPTNQDMVEAKRLSERGAEAAQLPDRDWSKLMEGFTQVGSFPSNIFQTYYLSWLMD